MKFNIVVKIGSCLFYVCFITNAVRAQSKVNPLKHFFTATVNDRALSKDKKWTVYRDTEMEKKVGTVSSGNVVTVTGWSSLLFQIETDSYKGFISSTAVNSSKEIDSLVLLTKIQFETEPRTPTALVFKDSAKAELVVATTKKEVILGECFVLNLSFNISDSNRVRMQFHDLGSQLFLIAKKLADPNCWTSKFFFENVEGVRDRQRTTYPLLKASYCPTKEGLISFPSVELSLNRFKGERFKQKAFKSKSLSVKVLQGPPATHSSLFYNYRMCGNFQMEESFSNRQPNWSGTLFYSVEIKGDGLTYPIPPPKLSNEMAEFKFIGSTFSDTIINDVYSSRKKFNYRINVKKEGDLDLNGVVRFKYLNPTTLQFSTLKSESSRRVALSPGERKLISNSAKNLVILDLSQSMQIEDYKPSRMHTVLEGLRQFLASRDQCDTQVAVFGRNAVLLEVSADGSCYSKKKLDSVVTFAKKLKRGSSIGDAVMLGNMLTESGEKQEKLVIIGDGDDTFGFAPEIPIQIAKLRSLKIYSIGIGTKGLAPYGKDILGRPYMVDNTFDDSLLKRASAITGGQYFWAKDVKEVTTILEKIFK